MMNNLPFFKFSNKISFSSRKVGLLLAGLALTFFSCQKDPVANVDNGYAYFPDKAGRYIIYDVDSIVHNDFTKTTDTFRFQIKESIESIFYDNSGRPTLRIERYKKDFNDTVPYSSISWTLNNVWSANRTESTAEKTEENQRFIKLVFPVKEKRTWNGNAYNSMDEWIYEYADADVPETFGNLTFDSTLSVKQIDSENLIEKKYYKEAYAKNIGMVYKEVIDVSADSIIPFVPLMGRISKGVQYKMTINSYGSN